MSERPPLDRGEVLRGLDLRHAALCLLSRCGPMSVAEILGVLVGDGFVVAGAMPNKTVADALGHEVSKGRCVRVGRGRYGVCRLSRSTAWRVSYRWRNATGTAPEPAAVEAVQPAPRRHDAGGPQRRAGRGAASSQARQLERAHRLRHQPLHPTPEGLDDRDRRRIEALHRQHQRRVAALDARDDP